MAGREDPLQEVIQGVQQADRAQAGLPGGLRAVVGLTRRYLQLREDQRFHFDRLLDCWKQGWELLEAEEDLELRFLDKVEARALLQRELSRSAALARVARRRTEWEEEQSRWAAGDAPPTFLGAEERVRDAGAGRLSGQGISAGTARGMVRVVRHLGEARALKDGEILVARATDPGWTPLFLRAHGLVLELGGMLSHGAVVARELGLPAVVNVARATQVLKTGQMVTVDGSRGLVYVH
jgi:pyruvate,water dikinase